VLSEALHEAGSAHWLARAVVPGCRSRRITVVPEPQQEEAAAKLPVKMVPPLFLVILPATVVVVLGPAMIAISKELFPFFASAH
jgi:hypothetical protein